MTKPEDYTLEQFLSEMKAIIEANPDNINPVNTLSEGNCVYEAPGLIIDGVIQPKRHCVIGKFLYTIGLLDKLEVNDHEERVGLKIGPDKHGHEPILPNANEVLTNLGFEYEIAEVAKKMQVRADNLFRDSRYKKDKTAYGWIKLLDYPELRFN